MFVNFSELVEPTFDERPKNVIEAVGQSVLLPCKASGAPQPTIQWYFEGQRKALANSSIYTILSSGSLLINNIGNDEFGKYKCEAKNLVNSASVEAAVSKACKYWGINMIYDICTLIIMV